MTTMKSLPASSLHALGESHGYLVLDVRDPGSFSEGHIHGAIHLDDRSAQQFITDTSKNTPIVVCCYHGNSSQLVAHWLLEQGYEDVSNLEGGYAAWQEAVKSE